MNRLTENKVVLVTRRTRLDDLVARFNTVSQAKFYVEHLGADFSEVPLTSLKPALGHLLGACGAVEAVAAIVALREHIVPPTLNTRRLDPALPRCTLALELMTPRAPAVLLLAESFGGRCAALTIRAA